MNAYDSNSLRPAIAELERWAAEMILWFEPQRLPRPVITIQCGDRRSYGWFAWSRWENHDGAILDEINFVPEYLSRNLFDTAGTLLHELVHLANFTAGIKDFSSNRYHNGKFRDRAVSVGMSCERFDPYGWAKTGLTPVLHERIALLQPNAHSFDLFRLPPAPRKEIGIDVVDVEGDEQSCVQTKKKKLSKWTCFGACAAAWVASGTELQATCDACGGAFVRS
jgi:hypothetical protein